MERNYSIDFIKFLAIFAVVCIHTGTFSGVQLGPIEGDLADQFIDTFARFAVPFFFVTSGYLFVQKIQSKNDIKSEIVYFKKYTVKLIKLWAAWFSFYFIFDLILKFFKTEKSAEALSNMFSNYVSSYMSWETLYYGAGHTQYHLWFLPALILSIIILFFFAEIRLIKFLVVIGLALNIYGLFGQSYSSFVEVTLDTSDALFFGLFYVSLGGLLAKYDQQIKAFASRIPVTFSSFAIILLSILQVVEGYITLELYNGKAGNYFITTIPLIIILFLTITKYNKIGKDTIFSRIGANAVGIYVSHVFIMKSIRVFMDHSSYSSIQDTIWWNVLFTPTVLLLAYIFYSGLQIVKEK